MTEDDLTPPRAVAIGIPDRLRHPLLENLPNVVLVDGLVEAAAVLDTAPQAMVIYGEITFGAAVSGQPIFLVPDQAADGANPRVALLIDTAPNGLNGLAWDDPRKLAAHAGIRLGARYLVDVSEEGAWAAFSALMDEVVAIPPGEGVPSGDGNDEPNGDPDVSDQPRAPENP